MENNNSPIEDYRKVSGKRLKYAAFLLIIMILIINYIMSIVTDIRSVLEKEKNQIQTLSTIGEKNREISLITNLEDRLWLESGKEVEFDNGIKIPISNYTGNSSSTVSWEYIVETNCVAHNSPAVRMTYNLEEGTADFMLDVYGQSLNKSHGYEKVMYVFDEGERVYTREESDGYFSYVILKGKEAILGVSYGKPDPR